MVTLSGLISEFVQKNEGENVRTVVVDKDVRQTMPDCNIVLCRFHVAKTLYEAVKNYFPRGDELC